MVSSAELERELGREELKFRLSARGVSLEAKDGADKDEEGIGQETT